jgi:uncharacterized protein
MPNIWLVFLTGLTTGGLSCLAVQGGLLANVIGNQAEDEISSDLKNPGQISPATKKDLLNRYNNIHPISRSTTSRSNITLSIILFLISKIIAYTILGLGLGYLGTMIQLSPIARGFLMIAITVFMLGTALRMLNVHPIFRYFQIQPPRIVRKFIRRFSKNRKEDFATPVFLGALTVLIPCGITQAMMALAIGTGSPLYGAVIMFAFTVGASPLFFILAYFTTRISESLNANFVKVVAVIILIFALYSLESGLNLIGSPVSYAAYKQRLELKSITSQNTNDTTTNQPPIVSSEDGSSQILTINATDYGYEPRILKANANSPTRLILVTNNTYSCSRAFVIPSLKIQEILEETGTKTINIPPQKPGFLKFTCSMGMYTGNILFD